MLEVDLQLFAEDQGAMGETGGDVTGQDAQGGQQPEQAAQETGVSFATREAYEEAVGQRIQAAIQQRFRNQKDLQGQIQGYQPIMQALGAKYGVDPGNVQELVKRVTDDDDLYAEEASRQGVTPQFLKTMKKLEFENQQLRAQEQQSAEERALQQHWAKLSQQAEQMKQQFPEFDLMAELKNERFRRMTAPDVGISVHDAYYAIHGADIQRQSMQYAAQQAGQKIAASVRAGASRPMENGMSRQQTPVNMGVDIANMDKATREQYKRRIKNGELINFVDKI